MSGKKKEQKRSLEPDVAGLAHDIKTPLSVIKGFLNAIDAPTDEMEEFHGAAKRSLEKILVMVDRLKEPVKKNRENFSYHDIAAITCDAIEELRSVSAEHDINVHYIGPNNLMCKIDSVSVSRAITNLILNAIEASKPGDNVLVELFARGDSIHITVSDTGLGIDETALPFVFERGFTLGKRGGSGIGLSICKETAENHSGSIDVFSKKDSGTVFTLTLPTLRDKNVEHGRIEKHEAFYRCFGSTLAPSSQSPSTNAFTRDQAWFEDTLD